MKYVLTALCLLLLVGCAQETPLQVQEPVQDAVETAPEPTPEAVQEETAPEEITFSLTGENFKFLMNGEANPTLRVKEGDTVRVAFTSTSGFHDWVVDEFNAATEKVRGGSEKDSSSVTFVADTKGTFEYYCSVGAHRAQGMKGMLIVE